MTRNPYYVYHLLDPRDGQPFYVGHGKKDRMYHHIREVLNESYKVNTPKVERIRQILDTNLDVEHKVIKGFNTKKEAQQFEIEQIRHYGRVDQQTGTLLNLKTGDEKPVRKQRRVCQYNRFGELIEIHESTNDAAEKMGIKHTSSLANAIRGRVPSYLNFLWTYEGEQPRPLQKVQPVYQWSKDGQFIARYQNAFRAADVVNAAPAQVNQHISKRKGSVKGYVFSRDTVFPGYITERPRRR